uniref:Uncharacterized protein n=1 Tax=Arundo donax TaxID=35708 RepID=A0A0A9BCR6_ARUDO
MSQAPELVTNRNCSVQSNGVGASILLATMSLQHGMAGAIRLILASCLNYVTKGVYAQRCVVRGDQDEDGT